MAGTRTVYRGSRGRFAGSSRGKAETVKVGAGYKQSGAARPSSSQSQRSSRLTRAGQAAKRRSVAIAKSSRTRAVANVGARYAVAYGAAKVGAATAKKYYASKPSSVGAARPAARAGVPTTSAPSAPARRVFVAGPAAARPRVFTAGPAPSKAAPKPNYGAAAGRKEYVGRRLKPGEGRGFKIAGT